MRALRGWLRRRLPPWLVRWQGKILTNIEPAAEINDVALAHVHRPSLPSMVSAQPAPDSGLIIVAGESERIMTFFVPELGMAPKWCVGMEGCVCVCVRVVVDFFCSCVSVYRWCCWCCWCCPSLVCERVSFCLGAPRVWADAAGPTRNSKPMNGVQP